MKTAIIALTSFLVLSFAACNKHDRNCNKYGNGYDATLVRDCTGTYLRVDGKDFHVCNVALTDGISDGTKVKTVFYTQNNCPPQDSTIICAMYHQNEGWIEVKYISVQ